jgi:hypothetical protein
MEDPIYELSISRGTLPSLRGSCCHLIGRVVSLIVILILLFSTLVSVTPLVQAIVKIQKKKVEIAWKGQ